MLNLIDNAKIAHPMKTDGTEKKEPPTFTGQRAQQTKFSFHNHRPCGRLLQKIAAGL
jgi:hypothetical protein